MTQRRSKGKAREERVVEAAAAAIAERGLANVRISDVADRAGMSPGHVTYYFPSKTVLLMRAIRQSEESLTELVVEEIERLDDPWHRLDKLIELSAATGPGDPGWALWFEVWSNATIDPEVARVHDELDARWRAILQDVLEYGRGRGAFVVPDPARSATVLSALIDGLSIRLALGSAGVTRAVLIDLCRAESRALLLATAR